jgi:hypothetical protein
MSAGPSAWSARVMRCSPAEVFAVLADGWLYPSFVVGTSRMREVDAAWPSPGSRLHHSFGVWPAVIDDRTEVIEADPPSRLVLRARGWPIGEARVSFEISRRGERARVVAREEASAGPGRWVPRPVMEPLMQVRLRETLRRLSFAAEGRGRRG